MPKDLIKSDDDLDRLAVSERGTRLRHTEKEVDAALKLLVINGDNAKLTSDMLAEEGIKVERETLSRWRQETFPRRYSQIRSELAPTINENLAGRGLEIAMQGQEAVAQYIEQSLIKLRDVHPDHLAKNVQALAAATTQMIERAQVLRSEPNQIEAVIDVSDSIKTLERLGVFKQTAAIDVEVVEEE
ncbi:MAG: hypothetical protein JSS68_15125 [Actinobacteria bacterium]|nr:hypothetical protein [Actinomycetota bacterium]